MSSHPLYLVQRLIDKEIGSEGFYSFTYKLKERVDYSTRSFNLVLSLKIRTQRSTERSRRSHSILRTD